MHLHVRRILRIYVCCIFSPISCNRLAFDREVDANRLTVLILNGLTPHKIHTFGLTIRYKIYNTSHSQWNPPLHKTPQSMKANYFDPVLQWIPEHCDITGNERAGNLEKKKCRIFWEVVLLTNSTCWRELSTSYWVPFACRSQAQIKEEGEWLVSALGVVLMPR